MGLGAGEGGGVSRGAGTDVGTSSLVLGLRPQVQGEGGGSRRGTVGAADGRVVGVQRLREWEKGKRKEQEGGREGGVGEVQGGVCWALRDLMSAGK